MVPQARQKSTLPLKQQRGIETYAQAKKPGIIQHQTKRTDLEYDILDLATSSRKRKAATKDEDVDTQDECIPTYKRTKIDQDPIKLRLIATPNRSARKLANIPIPSLTLPSTGSKSCPSTSRQPSTSPITKISGGMVPEPLSDFTNLHRALLRALTLHIAHNGTISPVPLSSLLPSASKIWGRRSITIDDIRRCFSNYRETKVGFCLYDFGLAGLCIEFLPEGSMPTRPHAKSAGSLARVLDEDCLQGPFEDNLLASWDAWNGPRSPKAIEDLDQDAEAFIQALPMLDVPEHPSLLKSQTGSKALGRARLEMLTTPKHHKAQKSTDAERGLLTPSSSRSSSTSDASRATPTDRKSSLYARLASKSAASPNKTKPSAEAAAAHAQRQTSLHFLPELTKTLSLLSKGKRRSFGLAELVRTIKESSRNVMEEAVVKGALDMLGGGGLLGSLEGMKALAPEFVKIVRIGEGVIGVVVDGGCGPGALALKIGNAIAAFGE